jgi:hypothetical protein
MPAHTRYVIRPARVPQRCRDIDEREDTRRIGRPARNMNLPVPELKVFHRSLNQCPLAPHPRNRPCVAVFRPFALSANAPCSTVVPPNAYRY